MRLKILEFVIISVMSHAPSCEGLAVGVVTGCRVHHQIEGRKKLDCLFYLTGVQILSPRPSFTTGLTDPKESCSEK